MELTALQQLVHQMYIAYYQRPADPDGLQYWVDQLEQNGDWTAVSAAFGAPENEENQALYGDLNREQTIAAIYQSAFNREAVAEEVAFWAASEFSATDLTFAIVNGAQNSDKATVDNKVAFSAELVAQVGTNAAYAELQDPKALLTAVTEETEVTAGYVSDAVASGKVGETFSLTDDAAGDTFVGSSANDTVTATTATLGANDTLLDQSSMDNDVINLTATGAVQTNGASVTGFETLNVNWDDFADATADLANFKGLQTFNVTTEKLGNLGNLTVNNTGAVNVVAGAGITGALDVNGVTTGTVETGVAKSATVDAAGTVNADDTVTVNAGEEATTLIVGGASAFDTASVNAGAKTTTIAATSTKAATVTAGAATNSITTTTVASTIDASAAAKDAVINVNGTAGTVDSATVTIGNDAVVNSTLVGTETLTLNVADGKVVTLTTPTTATGDVVDVQGEGSATLKGTAANLTADTITKSNAGQLNVELTDAAVTAAVDTSKIAADSIKLTAGTSAVLTAKTGQSFEVAANAAAATIAAGVATDSNADALSLKLTSAEYAAITQGANDIETLTLEAAAKQATGAATATDLTITSLTAGADNTVVLNGTNDVAINAVVSAKAIDASALNGNLTVGATTALDEGSINGATGVNTITYGDVATGTKATFVGQSGNDVVNLDTTAGTGQATFVLGAGNDRVNVSGISAGVLSVQGGDGDDTVVLGTGASPTGTMVLEFGNGNDTLQLADGVNLNGLTSTVITGLETLNLVGDSTVTASQVSGQSMAVTGAGYTTSDLTVAGSNAADTIDLSNLTATDSATSGAKITVNAGDGNDTVTGTSSFDVLNGGAGNDTINGGAGNDSITGGAGADTLTGGAGNDAFVVGDTDSGITLATADTITDFATTADTLALGTVGDATAGTGNYVEADAAVADFAAALSAANTALTTLSGTTTSTTEVYAFQFDGTNGYLFEDTDVDGVADQVIVLAGIDNTEIAAADIVA